MKLKSTKLFGCLLAAVGLCGLGLAPAKAVVSWSLGQVFSGGTPSGSVQVTLANDGFGGVVLTIDMTDLATTEFLTTFSLNFGGTPAQLAALTAGAISGSTAAQPSFSKGFDSFQADGDGKFDIEFTFSSANAGSARLSGGETISITLTGIGLDESQFATELSVGGPADKTGFHVAGHVQGIANSDPPSGWVTVPEPSTYVAAALLLIPLLVQFRRWKRTA